eukprot:GILJ01022189.1.p1 GENE.GILJ01022189.1~~GILJ01022189.1.p1  ORF type:complete len:357 (-),score=62.15 GILJ01022189.1:153-1223(-)
MNNSELNREGSQLWVPTSEELTAHAAGLATGARHVNNFPPSRHCTEQFTGPAGPNPAAMIDFTAENVRQQIEESEQHELVAEGKGFDDEEELYQEEEAQRRAVEKPQTHRQVHNPYSVNQVYLKVEPGSNVPEQRQQSDYFPEVERQRQVRTQLLQQQQAPSFVAMNGAGILFMPPRPPNIDSFDVFVKGGDDQELADRVMTSMIYRWYSLCSVNVVTYRNWYRSNNGPEQASSDAHVGAAPPNPAQFVDLTEWCFQAQSWWDANFATHQQLRHNGPAAHQGRSQQPNGTSGGQPAPSQPSPSKRAPAVPQRSGNSNNSNSNNSNPSFKPNAGGNSNNGGGHPPRAVDNSSGSSRN